MVAAEFFAGAIQDAEGASQRRHQAEHGPTQSCLARAVRADDPYEFRFENAQRNIFQCDNAWKAEGRVVEPNNGVGHARRRSLKCWFVGRCSVGVAAMLVRAPGLIGAHYNGSCRGRSRYQAGLQARSSGRRCARPFLGQAAAGLFDSVAPPTR